MDRLPRVIALFISTVAFGTVPEPDSVKFSPLTKLLMPRSVLDALLVPSKALTPFKLITRFVTFTEAEDNV